MPVLIGEKYTITGGLNTKCSDSKGSGTKNIQNIILFGKLYNYDTFMLVDDSRLNFKNGTKTDFTQCNSSISVRHMLNRFQLCVYWFNSRHHWLVNGIKK
jgi:hypothetical protein